MQICLARKSSERRKKSILLHRVTSGKKARLEGLFTLEKLNELFRASLCGWSGKKSWSKTWKIPALTASFPRNYRETAKRGESQLVGERSRTMESTFAVWTSVPCGMCRLGWESSKWKSEKQGKTKFDKRIMLFNFWPIFSVARRKSFPARCWLSEQMNGH